MEEFRKRSCAFEGLEALREPSRTVLAASRHFMLEFWTKFGRGHVHGLAEARCAQELKDAEDAKDMVVANARVDGRGVEKARVGESLMASRGHPTEAPTGGSVCMEADPKL